MFRNVKKNLFPNFGSGKEEGDQELHVETVENGGLRKSGEDLSAVRANMDYSDDEYGIDYFDYRHDERKKLKCKCSKVREGFKKKSGIFQIWSDPPHPPL